MPSRTRRALPTLALLGILAMLVALSLGLLYAILSVTRTWSATLAEAWRLLFTEPYSLARILAGLTIALILVAGLLTPIALLETQSVKRFARREEELRRDRPDDVVTPYEGEEGTGVAFDGPLGRLLLLRPVAGIGRPREVAVPSPPPPAEAPPEAAPPLAPERPSPADSSP